MTRRCRGAHAERKTAATVRGDLRSRLPAATEAAALSSAHEAFVSARIVAGATLRRLLPLRVVRRHELGANRSDREPNAQLKSSVHPLHVSETAIYRVANATGNESDSIK